MPLPEGRKPITDAELASLTRKLADTAIDYKARCEELEALMGRALAAALSSLLFASAELKAQGVGISQEDEEMMMYHLNLVRTAIAELKGKDALRHSGTT